MRRTEALQGVRVAMFLNVRSRWESAELNEDEAAELLGVSTRTFRRWRNRCDEHGEAGLLDQRLGKASGKRVPTDRAEEVEALYRERYQGFTVKHFHEHLVKDHGFGWGYTWTKLHLQWKGLVAKAPRKGAHRRKRERRPLPGMMLHQDGSRHVWLEGQEALDLIVTLDDATGAIYSAFLTEEEGTASTFRALKEVFSEHGLPMSLYTDRGAHYFRTTKAGEIDRGCLTQVGRALKQLGVEHIGAYSPQARGRSERAFQTLQDRLVKELKLAGIVSIEAANAFIREVYLPAHNQRFAVEARSAGDRSQFVGRVAGMPPAAAAEVQAEFVRSRIHAAFQRADDRGRDAGGMPVHAHHAAERLEPERVAQAGQQFGRSVMVEDAFDDGGTELGHPIGQPRGHTAAVERKIGVSGAFHGG